jgi:hypothetical protein
MRRLIALLAALALVAVLPAAASGNGATTTGTWTSYPPQVANTLVTVGYGTTYRTTVRPPINADGTSNFAVKRGVVPVQFDLLAASTTTTTRYTVYEPPVWESVNGEADSWSWAALTLDPQIKFKDLVNLSAAYSFWEGDCYGGSLRWTIRVLHDGTARFIHVYYGNPNGPDQSCSGAASGSGQNLITTGITPNRFEMQGGWGVPGPVYTTYSDALASTNAGEDLVTRVQLTLDSGWLATQHASVSEVTVNDNTWVPKVGGIERSTVVGDFAATCALPDAEIRWARNDGTPTGGLNEDYSVQPGDSGQYFRAVDCKYLYNLDVSLLDGIGTYTVWASIEGDTADGPAVFDLR